MNALSIFPFTWIAFELGMPPVSCYIIYIVVFFLMIFAKIKLVKDRIYMSGWDYVKNVLVKAFLVTILSLTGPVTICLLQDDSVFRLIEVFLISPCCTLAVIYFVGMNVEEKAFCLNIIKKKIHRQ